MDNSPTRWGILGTGQIAHAFAIGLRDVPHAIVAAVGSRNLTTAQAFAHEFNVDRHYGSYELLVADPDIDVIYIATPHSLHAENAIACLNAGKAVLCEKPFTINLRQAKHVVALARQKNLFLMEAMWTRFLPAAIEAKKLLAQGVIGTPHQLQADFGFAAEPTRDHRLFSRQLGGGALLDVGIYPLSMAAYLLGEIDEVQAQSKLCDTGVDTQTAFTLRHRSGALSSCICSIIAASSIVLTISGTAGTMQLNAPFFKSQSLTIIDLAGHTRRVELPYLGNGYTHEAIEVGRCLREQLKESPLMPLDETLALMACLDKMRAQCGITYPEDEIV